MKDLNEACDFLETFRKEACAKYESTCDECPFGHWEYQGYECGFTMFGRMIVSFIDDQNEIDRIEAKQ